MNLELPTFCAYKDDEPACTVLSVLTKKGYKTLVLEPDELTNNFCVLIASRISECIESRSLVTFAAHIAEREITERKTIRTPFVVSISTTKRIPNRYILGFAKMYIKYFKKGGVGAPYCSPIRPKGAFKHWLAKANIALSYCPRTNIHQEDRPFAASATKRTISPIQR